MFPQRRRSPPSEPPDCAINKKIFDGSRKEYVYDSICEVWDCVTDPWREQHYVLAQQATVEYVHYTGRHAEQQEAGR